MWIGLVLLAAITSVPELVSAVSSAALVKLPDLALGDLLGSCIFNLAILALVDIIYRPASILSQASPRHVMSAGIGILLIAALRLGAIDMAIADILGSNVFNIAIITPVDIFYRRGPILSLVSSAHLMTAVVAIVMGLLVIAGLRFRRRHKAFGIISWYTPVLFGLYIFGIYALFKGISLG